MARAGDEAPRRSQGPQQRSGKKRTAPPPSSSKGRADLSSRKWLYLAAGGAAVVVAVALILVSALGGGADTASTPSAVDGTQTAQLLDGIPQTGNTLGSANAPVTLVEYADPRCPFCARWSNEVFPTLVDDYVRPGKVKIEYRGIPLLGGASVRPLAFVYAAGEQNRLWNVADLMYQHQGSESEAWVTDDLMRAIGAAVPGLNTDTMFSSLDSEGVKTDITQAEDSATADEVNRTPSFLLGQSGGRLGPLDVSSLTVEQFTGALDAQLAR